MFFFLVIDSHFLIPEVIVQIFNPIEKLVIPIGIPSKEAKREIEIHPVTSEAKKKESVQYNLELHNHFCASY